MFIASHFMCKYSLTTLDSWLLNILLKGQLDPHGTLVSRTFDLTTPSNSSWYYHHQPLSSWGLYNIVPFISQILAQKDLRIILAVFYYYCFLKFKKFLIISLKYIRRMPYLFQSNVIIIKIQMSVSSLLKSKCYLLNTNKSISLCIKSLC